MPECSLATSTFGTLALTDSSIDVAAFMMSGLFESPKTGCWCIARHSGLTLAHILTWIERNKVHLVVELAELFKLCSLPTFQDLAYRHG